MEVSDIRVIGLERTQKVLAQMGDRAKDLRPVLEGPLTNEVHGFFQRQFSTQGAAGGRPWAPLAPFTASWRAKFNRSGMPILQFSRRLWASLTKRSHPEGVREVGSHRLRIGTTVPTAAYHQGGYPLVFFGNPTGKVVPERQLAPDEMPAATVAKWDRILVRYLEGSET